MELYLRPARRRDVAVCAALYNADPAFLLHHLGRDKVDEGFVEEELEEMDRAGFARLLIAETPGGPPVALADLRGGEEAPISCCCWWIRPPRAGGWGGGAPRCWNSACGRRAAAGSASTWWTTTPVLPCPFGTGWATGETSG